MQVADQADRAAVGVDLDPFAAGEVPPRGEAEAPPAQTGGPDGRRSPERAHTAPPASFWRSPAGQPAWARPALLAHTALAGFAYAWGMNGAYLEPFYGARGAQHVAELARLRLRRARPLGHPLGRQAPGRALDTGALPSHLRLPRVGDRPAPGVEGMLTVLVLYRAVRRVAGAGAGSPLAAAMAGSPIVILLDRGNISDTLLILLTVLAADATTRAVLTDACAHSCGPASWSGSPSRRRCSKRGSSSPRFFLAYLVAGPVGRSCAGSAISRSPPWPPSSSPSAGCQPFRSSPPPAAPTSTGAATIPCSLRCSATTASPGSVAPRWAHTPAATGRRPGWSRWPTTRRRSRSAPQASIEPGLGPLVARSLRPRRGLAAPARPRLGGRRRGRCAVTNPGPTGCGAAVVLWLTWLVLLFGFFSAGRLINSYYVAALVPAIGALCAMGARLAWQQAARQPRSARHPRRDRRPPPWP